MSDRDIEKKNDKNKTRKERGKMKELKMKTEKKRNKE